MSTGLQELDCLKGAECWLRYFNLDHTFQLGFGDAVRSKIVTRSRIHAVWEFGTYNAAWRVVHDNRILLASQDSFDTQSEIDLVVANVPFGRFLELRSSSAFDCAIVFDTGTIVEVFGTTSGSDEYFHVFLPNNRYMTLSTDGWNMTTANGSGELK